MYLSQLKANDFRNLKDFTIQLSKDLNIITGDNAAGKSSLLESIAYLVGGRSFRTSKQGLLVAHDSPNLNLFGRFSDGQKLGVSYNKKDKSRKLRLNEENVRSLSLVASLYPVQVLSPESYHLIDSGPAERRKYLDWLLFHVEHSYQNEWNLFSKLLKHRNAFLRSHSKVCELDQLEVWNSQFLTSANKLTSLREELVMSLRPKISKILANISFEYAKDFSLSLYRGWSGNLKDRLKESVNRDFASSNSQYGPHKADLRLKIGSHLAKDILSRGQKKLLVNSLYLAQTEILKERTLKDSLFIVDDFSSELDESNQVQLVEALKNQKNVQIILSCLHAGVLKTFIKGYNNVNMFHVEHGEIKVVD